MNLRHFLIVFSLSALVLLLQVDFKINSLSALNQKTSLYNETIDNAVDDSLNSMLEVSDSFVHTVNLNQCSSTFFRALYAGFNLSDSFSGQAQLSMYVPILLVTDTDGFYIMYHSVSDDGTYTSKEWTPKFPYYYDGSIQGSEGSMPNGYSYRIVYTMTNNIKVNFSIDGSSYYFEGDYKTIELENKDAEGVEALTEFMGLMRASDEILSDTKFNQFRQSVMIYQITKKVNYYVNKHNDIAEAYGISYDFSLPESSMDTFARTINDISMLAIFQGYPYGKGTSDVYNRFSVSGARLFKSVKYYVTTTAGVKYYHRSDCNLLESLDVDAFEIFDTKKECASFGAYPCSQCKP